MAERPDSSPLLSPAPDPSVSVRTWVVAALTILLLLGLAAFFTFRHQPAHPGEARSADPYAANLPITNVSLSEATNGTGGKSTYVDGTISNTGSRTLTGAMLQVTFATDNVARPHRETLPLALIRTRVPYVDLQPAAADPILPGSHREFRLIFESLPADWDVKPPVIQVIQATLR